MNLFNSFIPGFRTGLNVAMNAVRNIHVNSQPLWFRHSPILWAEPLKKKKRIDPQVLRERAEKRVKRIQRDIRRLEKVARKFKPLSELEPPKKAMRDSERTRPSPVLSQEEVNERMELKQLWAVYKRKQHVAEMSVIQRVIDAQEKALDALQEASPTLYEAAIQPDPSFIPFKMQGPVETPPIENFDYPDGDYSDVTKVYEPILPSDPRKLRQLGLHKQKKF